MNKSSNIRPVLIFTYGNPSRGDDALGPAMHDMLSQNPLEGVELQTDFQLQIEHALDLEGRDFILFIDASINSPEPFELKRLTVQKDDSYTTHAMSPSSLLSVYRQIKACEPPQAWLMTIRGYEFGLGKPLSLGAQTNLHSAHGCLRSRPPWKTIADAVSAA